MGASLAGKGAVSSLFHFLFPAAWKFDTTVEIVIVIKDPEFGLEDERQNNALCQRCPRPNAWKLGKGYIMWQREIKVVTGEQY